MPSPQDKFVAANGISLHYLEWGNAESPQMILLHGLFGNAHYWDFFASALEDGFHIIALDQRGHGDSSWAEHYGPKEYVADLDCLIEALGINHFTLAGHSMGGITATLYAERYPHRVDRLIIVDIGPEIDAVGTQRMITEMSLTPERFYSIEEAFACLRELEPFCTDDFLWHQLKHSLKYEDMRYVFRFDSALAQTEMHSPYWLWDYLERIFCPALILRGSESDMLGPAVAQKMSQILPSCSLIEIERARHGIPGDNPTAFHNAVVNFLRDATQ